ncbi:beta-propeller fold lactonase family protein [Bifidobacterium sp. SO1]|uniref:lactonase family protein n=1 Tax=Bifidobacterium sp. SO1 TaxID=2809029 RepID=UPI001BDC3B4B|nr:beta-propeller fold lactonase family protein [Bifidobacterium sp. SO1]MBT1160349.1 beta-propeller fold lactonase family protein [Bifidobacterium sp. SO1]
MTDEFDILVGGFGALQGSHSPGIEQYSLQVDGAADNRGAAAGRLDAKNRGLLSDVPSPSWLERDGDMVYAVLENSNELAALRIEADNATIAEPVPGGTSTDPAVRQVRLSLVSRMPVPGDGPTHVAIAVDDRDQRHAVTADYVSGTVSVFPVGDDGSLEAATQHLHGEGRGPLPAQDGPHAHWILPLPDGRVLTTDLGADRVYVHRWHNGELVRVGAVMLAPGTGPRDMHILPSRDGLLRVAVVDEWGDTVTLLGCDANDGDLQVLHTVDLGGDDLDQAASLAYVPDAALAEASSSDAETHAGAESDGQAAIASAYPGFAYVGLRGSERIVTLRWDGERLQRLASPDTPGWTGRGIPSGGSRPRHLRTIGRYLVAANEITDNLTVFRIAANGEPIMLGNVSVGSPTTILPL